MEECHECGKPITPGSAEYCADCELCFHLLCMDADRPELCKTCAERQRLDELG